MRTMISVITGVAVCLLLSSTESIAQFQWEYLDGPNSSDVRSVALNADGEIYIVVHGGSAEDSYYDVLRSTDLGQRWQRVSTVRDQVVYTLAVTDHGTLLLGTYKGVLRSSDHGSTWTEKDNDVPSLFKYSFGPNGLIVANGGLTASKNSLAYSTNDGYTWEEIPHPYDETKAAQHPVVDVAIDSQGKLYAGVYRDSLFYTTSLGAEWHKIDHQNTFFPWYVFIDTNDIPYVLADWRMTYSTDEGISWSLPGGDIFVAYTMDKSNDNRFIAGFEYDKIFVSKDSGLSWNAESIEIPNGTLINDVAFDEQGRKLVCTTLGLFMAEKDSDVYERIFFNEGPPIEAVGIFPFSDTELLVSTMDRGEFIYDALARSWEFITTPGNLLWTTNEFFRDNSGSILASTGARLSRSTDSGMTWVSASTNDSLSFRDVQLASDGKLYAISARYQDFESSPAGLRVSDDNGMTWLPLPFHTSEVFHLAMDSQEIMYAADASAIFKSSDFGASWDIIYDKRVQVMKIGRDDELYICGIYGLLSTGSNGASWLNWSFSHVKDVIDMEADKDGILYVALSGLGVLNDGGVWVSSNRGSSWREQNSGIGSGRSNDIYLDRYGYLYLANGAGLYRTTQPVVSAESASLPAMLFLSQNYPNPVSAGDATSIVYSLQRAGDVTITLYNVLGVELRTVKLGQSEAGKHTHTLSTQGLTPGVYRYVLTTGGESKTGKMVVR
jgi:photosystem II stability/assembly factor-like uncharacterized protein